MSEVFGDILQVLISQPNSAKALIDSTGVGILTSSSGPFITFKDWLPVLSALVVVIIGSFIQFKIAQKQLKASAKSNLAMLREKWINDLRDQMSEFVSSISMLTLFVATKAIDKPSFRDRYERVAFLNTKVKLLIDPNEPGHRELVEKNEELLSKFWDVISKSESTKHIGIRKNIEEVIEISQKIMKKEWERIREIETS